MSKNVMISVVIPLYNKVKYIKRALDSVLAQTYQDFEVIVVNDGSTDGSEKVVEQYNDPRIRLIHREHINSWGGHAARNLGIREARADLIAFLDADDEWLPNFLETVMDLRKKFPQAAIWATGYHYILPNGREGTMKDRGVKKVPDSPCLLEYFDNNNSCYLICSDVVLVNKKAIIDAGLFPEGIGFSGDRDTWNRIALRYPIAWSPVKCAVYYANTENQISAGGKYRYYGRYPLIDTFAQYFNTFRQWHSAPDKIREFATRHAVQSFYPNLWNGKKKEVKEVIYFCYRLRKRRWLCSAVFFLNLLPTQVFKLIWSFWRILRRKSTKPPVFRNIRGH